MVPLGGTASQTSEHITQNTDTGSNQTSGEIWKNTKLKPDRIKTFRPGAYQSLLTLPAFSENQKLCIATMLMFISEQHHNAEQKLRTFS